MFEEEFYDRLIQLRREKGVSGREMSLSLGQSEAYINRIENRRMLPSMTVFFYICEYLGVTPGEFFRTDPAVSKRTLDAVKKIQSLDPDKYEHILAIIEDL